MSCLKKKPIAGRSQVSSFAGEPESGRGCAVGIDCRDDGKLQNRIRISRGQHSVKFRQILHGCERSAKFHIRRFLDGFCNFAWADMATNSGIIAGQSGLTRLPENKRPTCSQNRLNETHIAT